MRPLTLALIGLFLVIFPQGAGWGQAPASPVAEVSESEYQVLSDYMAGAFTGEKGKDRVGGSVSKIVIINKTQSDRNDDKMEDDNGKPLSWKEISAYLHKELPTLQQASLNSFREVNAHPASFKHSFRLPIAYELVDRTDIDAVFKNGGWWTDYYKKYLNSQGILSLSRVGFSLDGKQAVFFSSNGCGGKCGTGTYVVMERVGSGWRIAKEILVWIS
jgi:hypothetical protein